MSKVDWENAPDWADRVLKSLKGDVIFSDGSYFLGTDDTKTKHSEVIDTLPNGHEILAFEYESCSLIEMRPDNWKEGEKRMEPIVQNGNEVEYHAELENTREHYAELENNRSKYHREIKKDVSVDVYDVLSAFEVVNPAMQHALKKMLAPGKRGAKDAIQDMQEAIQSIKRAIELEKEKGE